MRSSRKNLVRARAGVSPEPGLSLSARSPHTRERDRPDRGRGATCTSRLPAAPRRARAERRGHGPCMRSAETRESCRRTRRPRASTSRVPRVLETRTPPRRAGWPRGVRSAGLHAAPALGRAVRNERLSPRGELRSALATHTRGAHRTASFSRSRWFSSRSPARRGPAPHATTHDTPGTRHATRTRPPPPRGPKGWTSARHSGQ